MTDPINERSSSAALARWLSDQFTEPLEDMETGREQMVSALVEHLDCTREDASDLIDRLERAGYLRYAPESRSIGGHPGQWVFYTSPQDNPDQHMTP